MRDDYIDAALGICVLGNRVIVTCAPNVIVFTDEDGDDRPDRREMLFTKTGRGQNDHSTHSFVFGPDGRLYWNFGNAGLYVLDRNGIATGYEGTSIGLDDGTLLTAFVLGETDDQLNVKVKGGILLDLDKKDIRLQQKQTVSVMPSGLERLLTFDELVDLVEYLTTLRGE